MTTLFKSMKTCGCCGKGNEVFVVGSTNAFGSCDLDMRPPEMQRSAMFGFIQFCEHCGYTAWDLEEKIRPSDELKKLLSEKIDFYDKVKVFERAAKIAELKGREKADVRHLYLIAAWAADDRKDAATATALRKKILTYVSPEEKLSPEGLLQLTDIARRAGEKETATKLLKRLEQYEIEPLLKRIAEFEGRLLADNDTACYTVKQVCDQHQDPEPPAKTSVSKESAPMNNDTGRQFFVCTITRDGELCDLKIYLEDYAEAALQKFMARRRHAFLKRRGLPTWFGTPTVCSDEHFKSVNEGCEIEASPLKDPLRQIATITGGDTLERKIRDMEQGKLAVDPAVIRVLERGLFQLVAMAKIAAKDL